MILVELKVFQEAERHHPSRYTLKNAWLKIEDGIPFCNQVGSVGWFAFPDNFCPRFLGEYPAIILGQIDKGRACEEDRFIAYP
jgi:hypothetical protein